MRQKEVTDTMRIKNTISALLTAAVLLAIPALASQAPANPVANPNLEKDVRHAINSLPYYGVFDDLSFSIDDKGVVTLSGEVMQYYVRNSAVGAVRAIPGVTRVNDQIEVLPLSPFDNTIRIQAYNAIFGYPALSRYAINSRPPIHIVVKNGNITLAGVVNNELDRKLVYNRIRALPNAFSVTNDLRLD
jgi:hyperosmotically inducible periplasmic protein